MPVQVKMESDRYVYKGWLQQDRYTSRIIIKKGKRSKKGRLQQRTLSIV